MSSRRKFIKQMGIFSIGSMLPFRSMAKAKKNAIHRLEENIVVGGEWDVIVVGGGPAGCTAAIAASREGVSVTFISTAALSDVHPHG